MIFEVYIKNLSVIPEPIRYCYKNVTFKLMPIPLTKWSARFLARKARKKL